MEGFSRQKFLRAAGGATLGLATVSPTAALAGTTRRHSERHSEKQTVKLTMWSHEGEIAKFLSRRARDLNASGKSKYEFEPVDVTVIPLADVPTKFLAAASAGASLPDIIAIEINAFSRYMKSNIAQRVLADLCHVVRRSRAVDRIAPFSSAGAFGLTVMLFAGIPTYTCHGRTSLVATAIAPTIPCTPTRTPASTVAW